MIKNLSKNKKKKGFTLIELIIVLAVLAIIAAIAIPNFVAVRDNSKVKADTQSCETIKRSILVIVADGTIASSTDSTKNKSFTVSFSGNTPTVADNSDAAVKVAADQANVQTAVKDVKAPQGKVLTYNTSTGKYDTGTDTATKFIITIDNNGNVTVNTAA